MFTRRVFNTALAFISLSAAFTAQAEEKCWHSHEVQAARVRDLQTLLMVGALECNTPSYKVAGHYNNFITNNRSALAGYNDVLKVRFMREQGIREGQQAYDRFTTTLANLHSGVAQATPSSFCQTVGTLVSLAQSATPTDLEALAESITERPAGVGETCPVPGEAAPTTKARPAVISVAPKPASSTAALVTMPEAASTPAEPAPSTTTTASAEATPAEPSASGATPSANDALRAAALAIQSAAAALHAAAAAQPKGQAATVATAAPASTPAGVVLQPEPIVMPAEPAH